MGTVIVGAIVAGMVVIAVRSMARDKNTGKPLQCGCDCEHCDGRCH